MRGSTLRRVDTVIVSVQGSHRDGKSSALGTSCRVLCVETLMVCSRIISSTYNDTNTTLITVRISHEVLRTEFRSLGGFFLHGGCPRGAEAGESPGRRAASLRGTPWLSTIGTCHGGPSLHCVGRGSPRLRFGVSLERVSLIDTRHTSRGVRAFRGTEALYTGPDHRDSSRGRTSAYVDMHA